MCQQKKTDLSLGRYSEILDYHNVETLEQHSPAESQANGLVLG